MNVTLLGTGTSQGIPVIGCPCKVCKSSNPRDTRLRTSVHIEIQGKSFVIDTGPDFRQQMLHNGIEKLDAVLYTHTHKDHTAGLDDVRPFSFKEQKEIPLYGTYEVLHRIKIEYYYAFQKKKYPGTPQLQLNEIGDTPFDVQGITFVPLSTFHMKMPVLGFRIGNFSYITDTNYIPKDTLNKLHNTEILVLNALQKKKHISHFNLKEAIQMAQFINAKRTYFTHISHKMGLEKQENKKLPKNIEMGYDGLTFTL